MAGVPGGEPTPALDFRGPGMARRGARRFAAICLAALPAPCALGQELPATASASAPPTSPRPANSQPASADRASADRASAPAAGRPPAPPAAASAAAPWDALKAARAAGGGPVIPGAVTPGAVDPAEREPGRVYGPTLGPGLDTRGPMPMLDWSAAPVSIPLKLAEALSRVSQRNPSVLAAWYAVRASRADLRSAKWRRFPTLSAQLNSWNAGANRTTPSLQLGMPIFTFGRIGAGIEKAEAEQALAVSAWRQRVLEMAATFSQAYYQYLLSSERAQILEAGVEEHRKLVASMERRVQQEVSPLADLELARSRTAQIQQDYNVAASQRATLLATIRELVQDPQFDPGGDPGFLAEVYAENWDEAEGQALEYDPARERLRAQAMAAGIEISASKAALFPQVDAVYSYDEFYGSRVGLALRLQSAAGLSQLAQINGAQARYSQALSQVGDLERQLRQDIAAQVIQNRAALERASISNEAAQAAGRVSGSYVRQFIAGRRSWLDVMNALRENVGAQLSEAEARFTVKLTNSQLYLRTGKWQPQLVEAQQIEGGK